MKELQVSEGMKVRRMMGSGNCSGATEGTVCTVFKNESGVLSIHDKGKEVGIATRNNCCCYSDWEIVSTKASTPFVPKFIVQYDGNHCEGFATEKHLRARIKGLPTQGHGNSPITVHDIKRTRIVTLGVKITIK